jgi:hypothetical protein
VPTLSSDTVNVGFAIAGGLPFHPNRFPCLDTPASASCRLPVRSVTRQASRRDRWRTSNVEALGRNPAGSNPGSVPRPPGGCPRAISGSTQRPDSRSERVWRSADQRRL